MLTDFVTVGQRTLSFKIAGVLLAVCASGCERTQPMDSTRVLRMATTTSTRDSALLDRLLPTFESNHRCRVDVVAVGTGAALKLGVAGDVDVLLVHARQAELEFMEAGHGIRHEEFMYNDFVLLGPESDPAGIGGIDPIESLQKIAKGKHRFVSRGDNSGTHMREVQLWESLGGRPLWDDYFECGQGMGPALMMADEKQSYVVSDAGTYLRFRDKISLVALSAPHDCMRNPYAAIVVRPEKHDNIDTSLANDFVDFLISPSTQRTIEGYRLSGQPLFHPVHLTEAK